MIELKNLSHNYRQGNEIIQVLKDVNLKINLNQTVGLIGPSGSGKSTLLNILGLIQKPEKGEFKILETSTNGLNEIQITKLRREKIGYIFQNSQLLV